MPITADTYNYSNNAPSYYQNIKDDVRTLIDLCHELQYHYYPYGGMVIQIEASAYILSPSRWFVSFTELNDGRQVFHEASGNGHVFNALHHPDAFHHFTELLRKNVDKWKTLT